MAIGRKRRERYAPEKRKTARDEMPGATE
jgi:hypothetical protein